MSSVREQILGAIVTAWNTDTPSGVPDLVRSPFRQRLLNDGDPLAADLYWLQDEEDGTAGDPLQMHELLVGIECRAVGSDAELPETLLDPLYTWAAKSLNDNRLGNFVHSCRIRGCEMSRAAEHRPVGKMLIALQVKYQSRATDAEMRA